jgi:hypothetical protein
MVSRRERYEARFQALDLAKKGDYELYNGMVTRLEQALEAGDIEEGMDDSKRSTHSTRERAHILLYQAASRLATNNQPKASSSSHSRQQAADWAKANAAAIEPRGNNSNRSGRSLRRSHSFDHSAYNESDTELQINTTKALLQEAAARLTAGGIDLEAGINSVIYEKLMKELGLTPEVNANSPSIRKSTTKASTEPSNSNSAASLRARREYAASMLSETRPETRPKESTFAWPPAPLALPNPLEAQSRLERRHNNLEILKNLKEKQQQNPAPTRRRCSVSGAGAFVNVEQQQSVKEKQQQKSAPMRRSCSVSSAGTFVNVEQQQSVSSTSGSTASRAREAVLSAAQAASKPVPIAKRSSTTTEPRPSKARPPRQKSDPTRFSSSKKSSNRKKKTSLPSP